MTKLLAFLGAMIGGYAGWALGAPIGFMMAYTLSILGTGVGIYAGHRFARRYQ